MIRKLREKVGDLRLELCLADTDEGKLSDEVKKAKEQEHDVVAVDLEKRVEDLGGLKDAYWHLTHEICSLINTDPAVIEKEGLLNKVGLAILADLLGMVRPLPKMEWPVLEAMWDARLAQHPIAELFIVDQPLFSAAGPTKEFLTYRADKWFTGWHHPGGYKGPAETMLEAVNRVAMKETGCEVQEAHAICQANSPNMARDPELATLWLVTLKSEPVVKEGKKGGWFQFHEVPDDLLPHHKVFHARAVQWIKMMRALNVSLPAGELERVLGALAPIEYDGKE